MGGRITPRVLMVGPDRSLNGGIVSVVDGYFENGITDRCGVDYLGTGVGRGLPAKCAAFVMSLVKYIRILDYYDIVHFHISAKGSYKRKSLMARMAKSHGKKVILHEHSGEFARDFEVGNDSYREDVRRTFGSADRVIVLSQEWHDYFAENVCDPAHIVVLHNGVVIPSVPCDPRLSKDVLFLGRLDSNKSPDVLLRASRDALTLSPETRLVFGGDGDVDKYQNLAVKLGISDRCDFLGWVSGAAKEHLFSQAGVYCLPSKNEGMPMSVIEAMAHGLPVVSTAVGGVPQLIDNGREGFLIDVDDEAALSDALCRLIGASELRGRMGFAAREKAAGGFSVEASIDGLVQIYSDLLLEEAE